VVDGILGSAGLGYRVVAHLVVGAVTIENPCFTGSREGA
jgi:hypothetical protein